MLIVAAASYAVGGLCMKLSVGLSRPVPTVAFLILFCAGAVLQGYAMRTEELGIAYVFVLGAEVLLTMLLSVAVLGESCPPGRIGAVALVLTGIVWLRFGS
jgi:quaternary ammonium compound-resistance protein SugE